MPTIPNGMKPVVENYAIGAPDGVQRTVVGGGLPRYGLEWDHGAQTFRVSMLLTSLQFSVWVAFFHHTIKNGSVAFDMPLDSGFGQETHSVTIVPGSYGVRRAAGDVTSVSFMVQAQSAVYDITETDALALIAAYEAAHGPLLRALRPVVSGYSFEGPDGGQGSEVRGGNIEIGLGWGRGCQAYRVTLILTAEQFQVWTTYFHHVAKKGAAAFSMFLDSGFGEEEHDVNIVPGSYSATRDGAIFVVSFGAEAESSVYDISAADATSLVDFYNTVGAETSALLERIAIFANQDTLVLQ